MIAFLDGTLEEAGEDMVTVAVGGVGYAVRVPASTRRALPPAGSPLRLLTYLHVREDALELYGFLTPEEQGMFRLLILVQGIGPKSAMEILSATSAPALQRAIASEDIRGLSALPGIGRKTAEKVIFTLREKIAALRVPGAAGPEKEAADAVAGLVALGYRDAQAREAVADVRRRAEAGAAGEPVRAESLLRDALKSIGRVSVS